MHKVLLCIQTGRTVEDEDTLEFGSDEFYLKTEEQMRALFPDAPEAVDNTAEDRPALPRGAGVRPDQATRPSPPRTAPATRIFSSASAGRAWRAATGKTPARRCGTGSPTRWASSPRWAMSTTSSLCGTSSATPTARASPWGLAAAPGRAAWPPTAWASPTWTPSAMTCCSSASSTPSG